MRAMSEKMENLPIKADGDLNEASSSARKLWTEEENLNLMHLWGVVKSQALISLMMDRSISSIQTQGSRLGLPQRSAERTRKRAPWTIEEDQRLDAAMRRLADEHGKVPIVDLADEVRRSIDEIVVRLEARFGWASPPLMALAAPPLPSIPPVRQKSKNRFPGVVTCLRSDCRRTFYSPGPWKRICNACRRTDNDDALGF